MSINDIILNTISPVTIFCGGYGSGKSELAVNYALHARKVYSNIALADMDIVNPYFRSREAKNVLDQHKIRLIAPHGKLIYADLPALPSEINQVLLDDHIYAIIDIGGNDIGAKVLGRFRDNIIKDKKMYLVVNPARPFQDSAEKIYSLAKRIMENSMLQIDGIINNSNLVYDTTVSFIEETYAIVKKASNLLKVPILFTAIDKNLVEDNNFPDIDTTFLPIELQLSPEWRKK